jgi:thiosulfate/3-mercaptopyruvate sulfurtransferase
VREGLRARTHDVLRALSSGDAVIVDTRSLSEYGGLTPHGSPRGGHVPRAVHLAWTDLFDERDRLLPRSMLRARLAALGIGEDTPVIAYCTGGVRSGFLYMVMRWAGYEAVRNYDGSFWEWSRRDELPVAR